MIGQVSASAKAIFQASGLPLTLGQHAFVASAWGLSCSLKDSEGLTPFERRFPDASLPRPVAFGQLIHVTLPVEIRKVNRSAVAANYAEAILLGTTADVMGRVRRQYALLDDILKLDVNARLSFCRDSDMTVRSVDMTVRSDVSRWLRPRS